MAGNFSYLLYNMSMYFSADVFALYESEHPGSPNPVTLSDVFFTLHASAATAYIMWQVCRQYVCAG
jgi:hypothetical protein